MYGTGQRLTKSFNLFFNHSLIANILDNDHLEGFAPVLPLSYRNLPQTIEFRLMLPFNPQ